MTSRSNSPASDRDFFSVLDQLIQPVKAQGSYIPTKIGESDCQAVQLKEIATPCDESVDLHAYLAQLKSDQSNLMQSSGQFKHLKKILEKEISTVTEEISRQDSRGPSPSCKSKGEKVNLTKLIMVPIDKHPKYNFVGRILGPRGMTVRQLEEETGCKIMVRGRGSCKVGMRRDRGTDDEPLHVLVQCEDFADVAEEKMAKALKIVNGLLTPPPDGKDELKRKQLIELSIINGTYRPTAATKVALQSPSQSAPSRRSNTFHPFGTLGDSSPNGLEQLLLAGLLGQQPTVVNPLAAEYAKTILALSMTNPPAPSSSLLDLGHYPSASSSSMGVIQQASLHQYLEATAMINAIPSFHDGSGDGPKKH